MEAAAVVTAVGEEATEPAGPVAVGDEVIAYPIEGSYAEFVADAPAVMPKPSYLTFLEAAA